MLVTYENKKIQEKKLRDLADGTLFRDVEFFQPISTPISTSNNPTVFIKIAGSLEIIEAIHNSNSATSISSTLKLLCSNDDFLVFNVQSQKYDIMSGDCSVYALVGELIVDYKRQH